jgi:hypothetical protein
MLSLVLHTVTAGPTDEKQCRERERESGSNGDRQSNEIYKRKNQLLPSFLIRVDL